ncbi:hypothetical protein E2C01_076180 [Portunus trituberculatus]|uniref:Uncharacterized protein n=1 Tax=Portunus trituberculatus TaxID=210409 RepID=A0A5B7IHN8_PORTR|nr:hypothetical protein [Portunus trituberculatus]
MALPGGCGCGPARRPDHRPNYGLRSWMNGCLAMRASGGTRGSGGARYSASGATADQRHPGSHSPAAGARGRQGTRGRLRGEKGAAEW